MFAFPRHVVRSAAAAVVAGLTLALLFAAPATARSLPVARGQISSAAQGGRGTLVVTGWAFDRTARGKSTSVQIVVNGRDAARVRTSQYRPGVNRAYHLTGRHGFRWVSRRASVQNIKVYAAPDAQHRQRRLLGARYLNGYTAAGSRIVARAARYVGVVPYVWGGTSPQHGFDCSGYAQYVYRHAAGIRLPRTAEQQRHAARRIPRRAARPGDLVFYLAGGHAYHVAIYAGRGRQYSAADPRDGIRYQRIWDRNVRYGTVLH